MIYEIRTRPTSILRRSRGWPRSGTPRSGRWTRSSTYGPTRTSASATGCGRRRWRRASGRPGPAARRRALHRHARRIGALEAPVGV